MRYRNVIGGSIPGPAQPLYCPRGDCGGNPRQSMSKNTGRCRNCWCREPRYIWQKGTIRPETAYDLIAVEKGSRPINMDAQAPNRCLRNGPLPAASCRTPDPFGRSTGGGFPAGLLRRRPMEGIW